jgi:nicotinamidase/pyrazinamidase
MKTALIIVDVQNDFCEGGALEVKNGNDVIPVINSLIKFPHFDYIIATQDWHPREHKSFAANHKNKKVYDVIKLGGIKQVLWPNHCIQRTKGSRFHMELNLGVNFKIFRKGTNPEIDSYSGFYDNDHKSSTGLTEYLRKKDISRIYVTGLATDYCVKFTAMDALKEGFETYIIKDAVKGVNINIEDSKKAVSEMSKSGIKIITSRSILNKQKKSSF